MRQTHDIESGFTLIEMLVAMVVVALVFAVLAPALVNMMGSSSRRTAATTASGEGQLALRMISNDISSAMGARGTGDRSDTALAGVGVAASTISSLASTNASLHDIVTAGPMSLTMYADVTDTTAGPERITWSLLQNNSLCGDRSSTNANWCVQRAVVNGSRTTEIVTRGRGTFPATRPCYSGGPTGQLFCYEVSQLAPTAAYTNITSWTQTGCSNAWRPLNKSLSSRLSVRHSLAEPATSIAELDRIISIGVVLPAGAGFSKTSENTVNTTQVVIRSRNNDAYHQAIMCGAR